MSDWAAFWDEVASIVIVFLPWIINGILLPIATLLGRGWGKYRSDKNWHDDIAEHLGDYTAEQLKLRDERIRILETELTEELRMRLELERAVRISKAAFHDIQNPDAAPDDRPDRIIPLRRRTP